VNLTLKNILSVTREWENRRGEHPDLRDLTITDVVKALHPYPKLVEERHTLRIAKLMRKARRLLFPSLAA
jgi:hypothetical protein